MPGQIKIYAPTKLPDYGLSEQGFQTWKTELRIYLNQQDDFLVFMKGGIYANWSPAEEGERLRVKAKKREDPLVDDEVELDKRNRDLDLFLSLIAKTVSQPHYPIIMENSTSLDWIYNKLREDYDIQTKGIHFLNILDLKYDESKMQPMGFYNQYRTIILNNLAQVGDTIEYKGKVMESKETLGPTSEDLIFLQVLGLIDTRLPEHIRHAYSHKLGKNKRLMDFKTDILVNIKKLQADMDEKAQLSAFKVQQESLASITAEEETAKLAAFRPSFNSQQRPAFGGGGSFVQRKSFPQRGGSFRPSTPTYLPRALGYRPRALTHKPSIPAHKPGAPAADKVEDIHCKDCWRNRKGQYVYNSHYTGDPNCPQNFPQNAGFGMMMMEQPYIEEETMPWDQQQYVQGVEQDPNYTEPQVFTQDYWYENIYKETPPENRSAPYYLSSLCLHPDQPRLSRIQPRPTQLMTVYRDERQSLPIHICLDSGATVSFISVKLARQLGLPITMNGQLSTLGDGVTQMPALGEIDVTFYRNKWKVRFRALVAENLLNDFIGGTTFMEDNHITQDLVRKTISVHDGKHVVMETVKESIMHIAPQEKKQEKTKPVQLAHLETSLRTLLPGQALQLPTKHQESETVLVEPWTNNDSLDWPEAQLCKVTNGNITVVNDTQEAILLGKKGQVKSLKISQTEEVEPASKQDPDYYTFSAQQVNISDGKENLNKISYGPGIEANVRNSLDNLHCKLSEVFNESLIGGYNGYYGPYECKLNWASQERPSSAKLRVVNYNHDQNGLLQEVMDHLTDQRVLADPQVLNIPVHSICPVFLRRKRKALDKPKHMLTKDDVRLLINFGPVNDKIKDVPTPMTTPDDVFNIMGRFKFIIVFDLFNGFFQNHMSASSIPWLGVMTPFGGLRVITRSAQGLLGMSEEFSLMIRRIIKEELQAGRAVQLVDDIIVGGDTQEEAFRNYEAILKKFALANIKVAASKTHVFPKQVDVLGWIWHQGGYLEPSPHRRNALMNTKQEDIKKVKDMRSWLGLFKTLRRATPKVSVLLDKLEQAVAAKDTKEDFIWTHELEMTFREAKSAVPDMQTLYLPSPDDQLCLEPDGAKATPGIGHVLYAIKQEEKIPVRFHSVKLPKGCLQWQPCEVEALAFANGIDAEYDLIRESKHPLLICPDSKTVADAVELIRKGKYSASSRINRFVTNVNRVPLRVAHISGKAKLNAAGDNQSRQPSECTSDLCTVCRFVNSMVTSVVDPTAKNAAISAVPPVPMTNRQAWKQAQINCNACKAAFNHLRSGKTPSAKPGPQNCIIREYCREASISPDNLLVVKAQPKALTGNISRERIVIPQDLLPMLLYQLHNKDSVHPTKSQLKAMFQRAFFAMDLEKHLEDLYSNCYPCSILQRLPKVDVKQESKAEVNHPHEYFHTDVIKRAGQNILLLVDHFSSFLTATLVPSEKAADLKDGLVVLSEAVRRPGRITVKADNAKGFESLNKNDQELRDLEIDIELADILNKNSNAVVDKSCQELEEELRKLSPEGNKISQATLARAVMLVNKKMRREGTLTAYEIHTARDSQSGENLTLNDEQLRTRQLERRQQSRKETSTSPRPEIEIGDRVAVVASQEKHKARDQFVVTGTEGNVVHTQKLLHPLLPGQVKFMSKVYTTDSKRLVVTGRQPKHAEVPMFTNPDLPKLAEPSSYDAVNSKFWSDDEEESDWEEADDDALAPQAVEEDGEAEEAVADVVPGGVAVAADQDEDQAGQLPPLLQAEQDRIARRVFWGDARPNPPRQGPPVPPQPAAPLDEVDAGGAVRWSGRRRKQPTRLGIDQDRCANSSQDIQLEVEAGERVFTPPGPSPQVSPSSSMIVSPVETPIQTPHTSPEASFSADLSQQDVLNRHRHFSIAGGETDPARDYCMIDWMPYNHPDWCPPTYRARGRSYSC